METTFLTCRYRIKDRASTYLLENWANEINFVWNYCIATARHAWRRDRRCLSPFDLGKLTSGSTKAGLTIPAMSVELAAQQVAKSARQHHKIPKFRSYKKALPWIPFRTNVKIQNDEIVFNKQTFRFYNSRPQQGKIKTGSFNRDARGRWFVSLTCEVPVLLPTAPAAVGIDLGLKTKLTLSDGQTFNRENLTKKHEVKLAAAQRAGKKKQVRKIHSKIKNQRLDWSHKTTTAIVKQYNTIIIGNVNSSAIAAKTPNFAKSVLDASWFQLKTQLGYKASRLGGSLIEVSEAYTTQTCSTCGARTGPKGIDQLGVREWACSGCFTCHDRDRNAALNILRLGPQSP